MGWAGSTKCFRALPYLIHNHTTMTKTFSPQRHVPPPPLQDKKWKELCCILRSHIRTEELLATNIGEDLSRSKEMSLETREADQKDDQTSQKRRESDQNIREFDQNSDHKVLSQPDHSLNTA